MSKRRKKKSLPIRIGETATKERRNQGDGVVSEVIDRDSSGKVMIKRHRSTSECVLDHYLRHKKLILVEHEASMKFRKAYLRSVKKITVDDSGANNHGDTEIGAIMPIISEQILRAAYKVLSPHQKAVIIAVCGEDEWPGTTRRFETFRRGLAKLIKLWRLA